MRERLHFLLLNTGHFLDHLFTLIFATVAALALYREWGLGYADLLKYATPGFFAFGVFALPAGWSATTSATYYRSELRGAAKQFTLTTGDFQRASIWAGLSWSTMLHESPRGQRRAQGGR